MPRGRKPYLQSRTCPGCGVVFRPATARQLYHDGACYHAFQKGQKRGRRPGSVIVKTCRSCGREFATGGAGNPRKQQIYCSQACSGKPAAPPARHLEPAEAAWFAGVLDAEGSIVWAKRVANPSMRIVIYNCHRGFIERCRELTGTGSIYVRKPQKPQHATAYYWQSYGENALDLLRQVLPWLIVKRNRAEAALAGEDCPDRRPDRVAAGLLSAKVRANV